MSRYVTVQHDINVADIIDDLTDDDLRELGLRTIPDPAAFPAWSLPEGQLRSLIDVIREMHDENHDTAPFVWCPARVCQQANDAEASLEQTGDQPGSAS